ncbi:PD-(D/E)XK nuclease family protein [Zobellia galactanivorans]|uniref:PD-(D/E)XK nuclease family protein n=1 Tax=Zobellia galactanivorans (strain DSM 12802 / CCUG 47099 / CIP 106680 / NCIMB 13871 / Dsij) TaxID=63186 RepID=UPI001C07034E|nr:PD-(D/E)XK nuclease family protein [Zobellia galactanivorans]MBU3026829.1 PD-(D/E)XK nuclease family protein [Zobellia galactanivorans]
MQSFLEEVVKEVWNKHSSHEHIVFVLPSKRAGTFLKNAIAKSADSTFFAPEIYSIETFIEQISGLSYATNTQQLFILYNTYLKESSKEKDSFYSFSNWAQTLLQDFNEIDRYLVDAKRLFSNLAAIQELTHWSVQKEKTQMMEDYLRFWHNLESLYSNFNEALLSSGLGHQGLVYREAYDKLGDYLDENPGKFFVFIGFNALNTAETKIIQHILEHADSDIYWDIDSYFLEDKVHDAGFFLRQHLKTWPYLKNNALKGVSSYYLGDKNINIIGVPKNVSQAKYTAHLLEEIQAKQPADLARTAVVLGDESLLNPVLNSIPESIERVNVTMGYPLNKIPLASLFDQFINLYINRNEQGWFYQNLLSFLAHPYVQTLLHAGNTAERGHSIEETIKSKNWVYINADQIKQIEGGEGGATQLLFHKETPSPKEILELCLRIIAVLKDRLHNAKDALALEYLYRYFNLFNQLSDLVTKYEFITDLKSLLGLYRELLSSETLDFQGEPLEGLQVMGMLESRNLDFETVIITSVNEGILPSGKLNNSFIPFDLKVQLGLPTYKEKDAVYTYHFYRLLQRAKNVYILYNTEPDVLEGGERSRLINQLLTDENRSLNIHESVASPAIVPKLHALESIEKDAGLIELIKAHALRGFSPTSLSNYVRNPIDFYKRNLLGIDDVLEVEETIAANTFGTIVHDTLEELYTPFIGSILTEEKLVDAKTKVVELVKKHFAKTYLDGDISRGKNLIAFNVVLRYIENFINLEIADVKKHQIKIIGLEENLKVALDIDGIDFPINLKGKLDRIDEVDGTLRIIDYKTGSVERNQLEIVNGTSITSDYKFSKAFQLLCYAGMYASEHPGVLMEAGIISFKKLGSGVMKFATKDKAGNGAKKETKIGKETLSLFSTELSALITEICDINIPFTEKEV